MSTWNWCAEALAAIGVAWAGGRIAALAGLVGAGLLLNPLRAGAMERGAQPSPQPRKESPYARYAREHARTTAEKKPVLVKPSLLSAGHGSAGRAKH